MEKDFIILKEQNFTAITIALEATFMDNFMLCPDYVRRNNSKIHSPNSLKDSLVSGKMAKAGNQMQGTANTERERQFSLKSESVQIAPPADINAVLFGIEASMLVSFSMNKGNHAPKTALTYPDDYEPEDEDLIDNPEDDWLDD
jgi:hypothetical protein